MALTEIGGGGYDYIQDAAPTGADAGEFWLDTSTDPPTGKVYADLGSGGQWTTDLLDAGVSTRATQSDILSDATPFDGSNIDAAISSVGGIDWASKTWTLSTSNTSSSAPDGEEKTLLSVSGSGHLINIIGAIGLNNIEVTNIRIYIDGTLKNDIDFGTNWRDAVYPPLKMEDTSQAYSIPIRANFTTSFEIAVYGDGGYGQANTTTIYVLD